MSGWQIYFIFDGDNLNSCIKWHYVVSAGANAGLWIYVLEFFNVQSCMSPIFSVKVSKWIDVEINYELPTVAFRSLWLTWPLSEVLVIPSESPESRPALHFEVLPPKSISLLMEMASPENPPGYIGGSGGIHSPRRWDSLTKEMGFTDWRNGIHPMKQWDFLKKIQDILMKQWYLLRKEQSTE